MDQYAVGNADSYKIGDLWCQLLAKNLPRLNSLHISNVLSEVDYNNLSDMAALSVSQLHRLTDLWIGTHALI